MKPAGLARRMAAVGYDCLVLIALLMLAEGLLLLLTAGEGLPAESLLHRLYLAAVPLGFFVGFWHFGGQTIGMRAWRIRVTGVDGGTPALGQLLRRAAAAVLSWLPIGLGFWWVLVDGQRLAWHDRLSDTMLVSADPV